jgi:hypothetical protein
MKKILIIGKEDPIQGNFRLISGYRNALREIYGKNNIKDFDNLSDLDEAKMVFILDEHFLTHVNIWNDIKFIEKCNDLNIKVIILNNEKIYNTIFTINEEYQKILNLLNNKIQYVVDIDDARITKNKLNKLLVSKKYKNIEKSKTKKDKIVFIGRTNDISYKERKSIIKKVSLIKEMDVIERDYNRTIYEYLYILSQYKYCLSPFGNINGFIMRFYEILLAGSIPIQQINEDVEEYYKDEMEFDDCIYFKDVSELPDKIKNMPYENSNRELWLEDYLKKIFKEDNLL